MKGLIRIILFVVALMSLLGCEEAWVPKVDNITTHADASRT
jgi:hypothetical protein